MRVARVSAWQDEDSQKVDAHARMNLPKVEARALMKLQQIPTVCAPEFTIAVFKARNLPSLSVAGKRDKSRHVYGQVYERDKLKFRAFHPKWYLEGHLHDL
jgi:hypothetical protein